MTDGQDRRVAVVTGGAGAIGSVLTSRLVDQSHEVRIIDNLSTGRRERVQPHLDAHRATLTVADLKTPSSYSEVLAGAAIVWHLAANPDIRKGMDDPELDLAEGTIATARLLEVARQRDVPRFAFSSSSVVYGHAKVLPTPEEYGPLEPESFYAAGKLAAEGLVSAYAHAYGMTAHIFRFTNIIGPNMTHGILPDFIGKLRRDPTRLEILGDGNQVKSYLRADDCVGGMLLATERSRERVNIFNLGATDQITARTIGEKVIAALGVPARIEFTGGERGWRGDVPVQFLSIRKMQALGWTPRWTSAEAIDRTIAELLGH